MTETIGGRIEIIGHAIATLKEVVIVLDAALIRDTSTDGRNYHKATIGKLVDKINALAAIQVELAAKFYDNVEGSP